MKKPNTFIIGLPRAGTTSLTYYLRSHPEVFIPEPLFKEPHFFSKDIYPQQVQRLDAYLQLFKNATEEKVVAESSVFYLFSGLACKRIKEFCPNAKIVICLRHPADFIQSYHRMLVETSRETEPDLSKAMELEKERKEGKSIPKTVKNPFILRYSELGKYSKYISQYYDLFCKDNIHFFMFDNLQNAPEMEYRKLLRFLGCDQNHKPNFVKYNSSQSFWARNIIRRNQKLRYLASQIPSSIKENLANAFYNTGDKIKKIKQKTQFLHEQKNTESSNDLLVVKKLHQLFYEEIEKIEKISGLDCDSWKIKSQKHIIR